MAAGLAAAAPAPAPAAIPLIQQRAFKPNGSPPPFDIEAERDTFLIWEERWNIFLNLSTIDEAPRRSPAPGIQDQPIEVLFFYPNTGSCIVSRTHSSTTHRPHSYHRPPAQTL
jgi:hypothetical protein